MWRSMRTGGFLYALIAGVSGVQYADICLSGGSAELCPSTFRVSALAFNPHGPGLKSELTLFFQPSVQLETILGSTQQSIHLTLPNFGAPDTLPVLDNDPNKRRVDVLGSNAVPSTEEAITAYNSEVNGVLEPTGTYFMTDQRLELKVKVGMIVADDKDTELRICCFILPSELEEDSPGIRISAPVSAILWSITEQQIKNTPAIERGNYWKHAMIEFDPPASHSLTVIITKLEPAKTIIKQGKITVFLPGIERISGVSGPLDFSTAGDDWLLFEYRGYWDQTENSMSFILREGKQLAAGTSITLRTIPGEFRLPVEVPANWDQFQLEARSVDGVDLLVPRSPVSQSDYVPHITTFVHRSLSYAKNAALEETEVTAMFRTNRPSYGGSEIYFRLAGFSAKVVEVPIVGDFASFFVDKIAYFDMPQNKFTLKVSKTLYSNEQMVTVTLVDVRLPSALYENDESLILWNSDVGSVKQAFLISPEVKDASHGPKKFIRSQIVFQNPMPTPIMPSNVSIILQPSASLYQDDYILIHLYGFHSGVADIYLDGPDTDLFKDGKAIWDKENYTLKLIVATSKVVSRSKIMSVTIPGEKIKFRLPDKLSANDGILSIEAVGTYIKKSAIIKSPALGPAKKVTASSLIFSPCSTCRGLLSEQNAKILIAFSLNCDVLPNSTVYFKLSGLSRNPDDCCDPPAANQIATKCTFKWCAKQTGYVRLSGMNAPLFVDSGGHWNSFEQILSVKVIPDVPIAAGRRTEFFIEEDQHFFLPYAMEQNDPSLYMYIPEAGISVHYFQFTTRVNRYQKEFIQSELACGDGAVCYPNTISQISIKLQPNVDLPQGTILRIHLPGFKNVNSTVPIKDVIDFDSPTAPFKNFMKNDTWDWTSTKWYANWTQANETLDLQVDIGKRISRLDSQVLEFMIPTDWEIPPSWEPYSHGFRLPNSLEPNDKSLVVETINNQIIAPQSIAKSPRVVERTFITSKFEYHPNEKGSHFLFRMELTPTVPILKDNVISILLPNFVNVLDKTLIHLTGTNASLLNSLATWNPETEILTMAPPKGVELAAFEPILLQIQESQGFILPRTLYQNDPRIKIISAGNTKLEQVKESMMVGDGPDENQRICMYMYETGTRTTEPFCDNPDCLGTHIDACSPMQLQTCDCESKITIDPVPLTIYGFQFSVEDEIDFVRLNETCASPENYLDFFDKRYMWKEANENRDKLIFHNVSSTNSGYFRMCFTHMNQVKDIGTVSVRPSCESPKVLVEGSCVTHCPLSKLPIAGECKEDPGHKHHSQVQAKLISIQMRNPDALRYKIYNRSEEDPEREYFEYRFKYELARILNAEATRFRVASISEGTPNETFIVNTVFKPEPIAYSGVRSPAGLLSLFIALITDENSIMWQTGDFLKWMDKPSLGSPIDVSLCESDLKYRTMCPYTNLGRHPESVWTLSVLWVFGTIFIVILLFFGIWRIDADSSRVAAEKQTQRHSLKTPVFRMDPTTKTEFARSWIESRFYGENRDGFSLKQKVKPAT